MRSDVMALRSGAATLRSEPSGRPGARDLNQAGRDLAVGRMMSAIRESVS